MVQITACEVSIDWLVNRRINIQSMKVICQESVQGGTEGSAFVFIQGP